MPRSSEPRTRVAPGTYTWFRQEIGRFMYQIAPTIFDAGPNPASWTATHREMAHQVIQQGEHETYHPQGYTWSFMNPVLAFSTATGQWKYEMPEDFAGVTDRKLLFTPNQSAYRSITKVDASEIRSRRTTSSVVTSFPQMFAEQAKPHDGQTQQRRELLVWPTPSGEYDIEGKYRVEPVYMSESRQHPYGGPAMQQVLLVAMKSVAEQQVFGEAGVNTEKLRERLQEAIGRDSHDHAPAVLGYNGNGPGNRGSRQSGRFQDLSGATYGNTNYGN